MSQTTDLKIAFFGTPVFAQIVLEKLITTGIKPGLVVTAPDAKSGRGQKLFPTPVKQTALKNKIEVLTPKSLSDKNFIHQFSTFNFQLSILVAYGKIIPNEVLKIPKFGFINVHPSLLPKYRGPSPIQTAILAGETKTGVTIMKLDEEVDHGPILAQLEIKIEKNDNNETLHEKLGILGAELLIKNLPDYLEGNLKPKSQNHSKATFTKHIEKQDGYINSKKPLDKKTIDLVIRAFYPWPTAWTKVNGKIIKFLPGNLIQPEGKRPLAIKEFLNGYPNGKELIEKLF